MDRYIFSFIDEDRHGIFRDLTSEKAKDIIDFLPSHKQYSNLIISNVEKVLLSYKLNSVIDLPGKELFCNLENYNYQKEDVYHIIIPTTSISKMPVSYLRRLKEKNNNIRLYALVTDSMHASSPHMTLVRDKLFSDIWEAVLTYDKYDAEEYGFKWFGYSYYSSFDDVEPDNFASDIYYVGFDKGGRGETIESLFACFKHEDIKARFDVVSKKRKMQGGIAYLKQGISYPTVVSRLKSSNCILEVLQNNQKSQSLRYFEAVVYNKKLLTMNKNIVDLPYYNPRYMKVFESIQDIDIRWIKRREKVDYGYQGDFSPLNLIHFIDGDKK